MEEAKPQILLWTAPEFPFRVTIPAVVLNEIRILAVEAFYSVPRGGVEVGGVFFGVREPAAIHIRAQRPIRCQYATGPSFTLSIDDQLGLSGLLDQASSDPDLAGMTPLGWYHSHTRSEIFLSPADVQLYNEFFHERWQIALVMRPVNLQPTRAGFFFRDRLGNLKSDAPGKEFRLEPPAFGLALLDSLDASVVPQRAPVAPPAAVVAPPPQPLPQPAPPAAVPVEPPPPAPRVHAVASPASEPMAAAIPAAVTAPEALPAQPTAAVAAAAGNGSLAVAAVTAETTKTPDAVPELAPELDPEELVNRGLPSFDLAEAAARKKRRAGWMWAFALVILLAVAGGAAFMKWGRFKPQGLGLETYDINGAFLIRWDRESSVILSANHATLEIEDGGEKTPIELSPAELSVGGYGYIRRTSQVSVHMKVDGSTPVEEESNFKGVQALGSQPAQSPETTNALNQVMLEKEHLKTELINESMQSSELRREITSLRKQLAEERAKTTTAPPDR